MDLDLFWAIAWLIGIAMVLLFSFVIVVGAPFLPTLRPQVVNALDVLDLKKGQTMYELGSGDGRVLIAAAQRGWNAVGYELNPLLVIYSWILTRKYRKQITIRWGNFWRADITKADGIFVFLLPKFMSKLDNKIVQETSKPVKLVSFAFKIPEKKIDVEKNGVFMYLYGLR